MATCILGPIRNVYIAFHQGTDSAPTQFSASTHYWDPVLYDPTSYPQCDVVSHIHDTAPTTSARSVLHDNDAPLPTSVASPDVPSSSVSAPLHAVENLTDMPPLDDFHPHQTATESLSIPVTSPDPATFDASGMIIHRPTVTSATSTSTPPLSSTSPPAAVALQRNADPLAPSDPPNHPSSASSPMLDNTLPTECPPSRSAIVSTAPCASTGPASAPDLSTAAKDDGSPKPGARKDGDIHSEPPSAIRAIHANTMVTLHLPPLSPSPLSVADTETTIAGPSLHEPNAERTGDPGPFGFPV
ncbi:hypothetical protein EDB84DRAFT_1677948 [Lactarius hengduanensis]|nr:hypothetical protein EDB84DRAFT_1677948 [Lactarius hengduanensis]